MNRIQSSLTVIALTIAAATAWAAAIPGVEQTTQAFLDAVAVSPNPPLEQLSPVEARIAFNEAQAAAPAVLLPVDLGEKRISVEGGEILLRIVRPDGQTGLLPAFMFFHGGGWVVGDFPSHERLVRDLVAGSGAVAVFVDYSPSPEAKYPIAVNQAYAATRWVSEYGAEIGVDRTRLAVAGNSVGGNMATVVALMAKREGGPALRFQLLLWPVTDANFENISYTTYADGYFLTKSLMISFWDAYTTDPAHRLEIYASPLQAVKEQLEGLPPALIQTAEFDVLRDEGNAYGRKLDEAGVDVVVTQYNGMIHDFALLNVLHQTPAAQAAILQAALELRRHLN